jgi:excisionase family DNA binding protein
MTETDIIEIAGKRFIRLSTFAEEMGLHIRTVQLWAKDHNMPVIRVGNQMLLDLDDIPAWFDGHKSKTAAWRRSRQSQPSAAADPMPSTQT